MKASAPCSRCGKLHNLVQQPCKYNGWTNYETWAVKLWMDNEESSYRYWNGRAEAIWKESSEDCPKAWTPSQAARFTLADEIKEQLSDGASAEVTTPCVYSDLLGAALSEVNYNEIADALLRDNDNVKGYESDN